MTAGKDRAPCDHVMITLVLLIPSLIDSRGDRGMSTRVSDACDGYEVTSEQSKLVHDILYMLHASIILFICLCHAHIVLVISCSSLTFKL